MKIHIFLFKNIHTSVAVLKATKPSHLLAHVSLVACTFSYANNQSNKSVNKNNDRYQKINKYNNHKWNYINTCVQNNSWICRTALSYQNEEEEEWMFTL